MASEAREAVALLAALAALPVSEPKTVLKPLVVTTTEPSEFVTVPTMGTTVTTLAAADWAWEASEPVMDAAADAAAPDAVARAPVKMGTAGGTPEPETPLVRSALHGKCNWGHHVPAHWAAP